MGVQLVGRLAVEPLEQLVEPLERLVEQPVQARKLPVRPLRVKNLNSYKNDRTEQYQPHS